MKQLLFALACFLLATADGFSSLQLTWGRRTTVLSKEGLYRSAETALWSTVNNDNGEAQIANDFKMFLTQCSVQSFMFLIRSMRDPQTVIWLEEFTQPAIVRKETGFPDVIILEDSRMVEEAAADSTEDDEKSEDASDEASEEDDNGPTEEPRKTSKLLQYHGLAALNSTLFPTWDSYFEQLLKEPSESFIVESSRSHIPDYELEIDPSSLCSRIISVREQISKEFVRDLQVIAGMGGKTLEWYWENLRKKQGDNETPVTFQRENLLFLELNADEHSDLAPSPLRRGNFDLLVLLATQESIHRVLNDETRQNGPERATNEFLRAFYKDRMHYFHGPQKYGRADDFLEELLSASPRMITIAEGVTHLIDPTRITELILEEREEVALEWKEVAAESPKEHMEIQRMRFNLMMRANVEVEGESFQ